jgi:hypothetical protein
MKKRLVLAGCVLLAGCGGPLKVSVYGKSGASFTAPDLCSALVECLNSNETSCFYDRSMQTMANGTTEEFRGDCASRYGTGARGNITTGKYGGIATMQINGNSHPSGQAIALACLVLAAALCATIFVYSRNDNDLKLLAITSAIGLVGTLSGIGGTLLVGVHSASGKDTVTGVPSGSTVQQADSTTITPPEAKLILKS